MSVLLSAIFPAPAAGSGFHDLHACCPAGSSGSGLRFLCPAAPAAPWELLRLLPCPIFSPGGLILSDCCPVWRCGFLLPLLPLCPVASLVARLPGLVSRPDGSPAPGFWTAARRSLWVVLPALGGLSSATVPGDSLPLLLPRWILSACCTPPEYAPDGWRALSGRLIGRLGSLVWSFSGCVACCRICLRFRAGSDCPARSSPAAARTPPQSFRQGSVRRSPAGANVTRCDCGTHGRRSARTWPRSHGAALPE